MRFQVSRNCSNHLYGCNMLDPLRLAHPSHVSEKCTEPTHEKVPAWPMKQSRRRPGKWKKSARGMQSRARMQRTRDCPSFTWGKEHIDHTYHTFPNAKHFWSLLSLRPSLCISPFSLQNMFRSHRYFWYLHIFTMVYSFMTLFLSLFFRAFFDGGGRSWS